MDFIDYEQYKNSKGIYRIRNIKTNKVYIGQTTDKFINRYNSHLNRLNRKHHSNKKLQYDWDYYGEDSFLFEIVEVECEPEIVSELEKYYISKAKSSEYGCYNKKPGGEKIILTDDGIKRVSKYMSNRVISEDTKQKLRDINTGSNSPVSHLTESDVQNIKIRLMNHENQKEISSEYGVSLGAISAIANNRTWTHVLVDGWDNYISSKKRRRRLSKDDVNEIKELLKNGELNQSEIARMYNCYSSTISNIYLKKTWV